MLKETLKLITVICPVYNEEQYIENVLSFFVNAEPFEKELLVVDGGSNDKTVSIVSEWQKDYPNIKLIINPKKYVPFALNIAIKQSSGSPIIRLDAHTEYASDYFLSLLETFDKTGADIVGGPMRKKGKTNFQKAVVYVTSTVLGLGGSKIHRVEYSGYSDHVYLGAWKRSLFEEVGYFDEGLLRNQDDEFHYRAKSKGKKIFLNSDIKSYYYPRSDFKSLIKQYFQYGVFKPIVSKKVKSEIKLRHIIPFLFVLYLFFSLLFFFHAIIYLPLLIYILLCLFFSVKSRLNLKSMVITLFVFPAIHISYGMGYIIGLMKLFVWDEKST
ncbi:MAG: glycosyltransferase [Ignavibacteria bacterium GWA2_35_9]|nr:MAG: glycosyltransferase [Ignavibacteria bacterium GWA2_35_9]OGU48093.1 MAG: glycosyltransferase [Ignavibacteria bacterium GWB2_36_8]OGU48537.1 MAG: glycosyltransferase [Ignavibacteria bacterium GWC2_36_12]